MQRLRDRGVRPMTGMRRSDRQLQQSFKVFREQPITMRKPKSEAAHGRDRDECFQEENSMSSPIASPQGSTAATPAPEIRAARQQAAAPAAQRAASAPPAVSIDAHPSTPPAEVLEQMAGAAQTYDELSTQGRELRFARDERSGRMAVEVRDRGGKLLKTLSPAQAMDVAAGGPLE